jgi:hypothetical protein
MLHTFGFFSSKCRLFRNTTFFGSCIIRILHTGCAKILNAKFRCHKVKDLGTGRGWEVSVTPRPLSTSGKIQYPLYRRLGGPQGRSGQVRKISPPTGIWSQGRPALSQSLPNTKIKYICDRQTDRETVHILRNKHNQLDTHLTFTFTFILVQSLDMFRPSLVRLKDAQHKHSFGECCVLKLMAVTST